MNFASPLSFSTIHSLLNINFICYCAVIVSLVSKNYLYFMCCRNHILGRWDKDVSCILPLSGCGVSATPVVDESPECSLIREIYAFLDHFVSIVGHSLVLHIFSRE